MTRTQRAIHLREAHQLQGRCMSLARAVGQASAGKGVNSTTAAAALIAAADALSRAHRALQVAEVSDE